MTIESYTKMRDGGKGLGDIQYKYNLSDATAWTLELGYQCYLKNLPLEKAIEIIRYG